LRCRDGTLYTRVTVDVVKRLEAHRHGVAAKYTRSRGPVTLRGASARPVAGAHARGGPSPAGTREESRRSPS